MFGHSKDITFVRKSEIITRNQRSLFKIVQTLLPKGYNVMYARPAYHFFDVDTSHNSKSAIKKGREMVAHAFIDIIVIEDESLKAVMGFRMDKYANHPSEWDAQTRDLVYAARSAKFPLSVVPDTKTFSSAQIARIMCQHLPITLTPEQLMTSSGMIRNIEENEKRQQVDENDKNDPWQKGGLL